VTSRGTKYWSSGSIPLIAPDVLGNIIAKASDIAIVISETGSILSVLVNPDHPSFGSLDGWEGRDIREVLTVESVPKLEAQLHRFMEEGKVLSAIELNHNLDFALEFPIRYSFHGIGPDGAILMLGRDLRPIAEMQQQLVKAQMALEGDYEVQREYNTRLRVLMEAGRDAFVFVNQSTGRIIDLNTAAAAYLGGSVEELTGALLGHEVDGRKRGDVLASMASQALSDSRKPVEIVARRSKRTLLVTTDAFRAAGERMFLCRIAGEDDLGAEDELSENLLAFYQEGVDAIVFTDENGLIKAANESFLGFVDTSHLTRLKSRSIGDFLARGAIDLKVLVENARRVGQMRVYATKLISEYGSQLPVEISATWLNDRTHPSVVFVIRDASRAEAVRRPGPAMSEEGVASVMELVGSASLKEIVADTTDVVEKMCIETAVELTRNNRVAAAEMLGLSRQSLYVKLRKYGILSRED
jgi:transcriptional regulator PpsR